MENSKKLEDYVINIEDFPEPGVLFRDITGILNDAEGLKLAVDMLAEAIKDVEFDAVAALEARGFFFGMPIAYLFNKPFIPIRKKGKLPRKTVEETYALEYGSATIEMHEDAVRPGDRVIIIDDLVATAGTAAAACKLIEGRGGSVAGLYFVIELAGFEGRKVLDGHPVTSLITYEGK